MQIPQAQTHSYVLYILTMYTEGIIYSRQHYFNYPPSNFFDPQSSLLSVLQIQTCTQSEKRINEAIVYKHIML